MFVKYQVKSGLDTDGANVQPIFQDLAGIFSGNITSVAGFNSNVCERAGSTWIGSLDSDYFVDSTEALDGSGNCTLTVGKFHSDWSTSLSESDRPKCQLQVRYSPTATLGSGIRVADRNGDGAGTTADGLYSWSACGDNSGSVVEFTVANDPSIFIWATKQWVYMQWHVTSGTAQMMSGGMFDYATNGWASSQFNQLSTFYPGVCINSLCEDRYFTGTGPGNTDDHGIYVYTTPFIDADGAERSCMIAAASVSGNHGYHTGGFLSSTANTPFVSSTRYLTLFPAPAFRIIPSAVASGAGHQLVPVHAQDIGSHYASTTFFPIQPRLLGLNRTSDNFAASGTLITYDSTQYAALALSNSGHVFSQLYDNLCDTAMVFLIPTTLDGN